MKKYLVTKKYLVEALNLEAAQDDCNMEDCIFSKAVEVEGEMDVID
jgi:hypothetical protein